MRLFQCVCGNTLFFDNTLCTACGRNVGWCPVCAAVRAHEPAQSETWTCTHCGSDLRQCENYAVHAVCNRMVGAGDERLCGYCALNQTIPDLGIDGNRERWGRLEAAKRRLLYALDQLGLPYGDTDPALRFAFMGDRMPVAGDWREMGPAEQVFTGHDGGLITINVREAEDATREALRVGMGEAHRTLIGHFRHEVGHYYWELLVRERDEERFNEMFGDPEDPPYQEALSRHYQTGPRTDWQDAHVSAYATMHPWEDWAETFAFYLDLRSVLETAVALGLSTPAESTDIDTLLARYQALGLVLNELNREMGLLDFAPEVITPPVREKLRYIDGLVRAKTSASGEKSAHASVGRP